ncbi:MAG: DUF4845 domain-containing protein [Rhodocyclales bacterium]|nr:DUF4845 domain-containing protein [Rhodocyclales bacterium]
MRKQKGMTLIGLIFTGAVVIGLAILGMKVAPSVIEYFTILKNIKAIAASGETRGSVAEVRKAYERRAAVDDTPSVVPADLEVTKEGNEVVISFAYAKKIPIAGNVSICIDFAGSSSPGGRSRAD